MFPSLTHKEKLDFNTNFTQADFIFKFYIEKDQKEKKNSKRSKMVKLIIRKLKK